MDGILTTSVRRNGIGAEGFNIFPSIESIEEIKVSSVNNTAEFAQLGDITTISRPGTNNYHGTAFCNYNSDGLNANPNYFNPSLDAEHERQPQLRRQPRRPARPQQDVLLRAPSSGSTSAVPVGGRHRAGGRVPHGQLLVARDADHRSGDRPAVPGQRRFRPAASTRWRSEAAAELHPGAERRRGDRTATPSTRTEVSNQFDVRVDQNFTIRPHAVRPVELEESSKRVSPTTLREPRARGLRRTRCRPSSSPTTTRCRRTC